jgi:hypothetical protein
MTGLSPELAVRQSGLDGDFGAKVAVCVWQPLIPSSARSGKCDGHFGLTEATFDQTLSPIPLYFFTAVAG